MHIYHVHKHTHIISCLCMYAHWITPQKCCRTAALGQQPNALQQEHWQRFVNLLPRTRESHLKSLGIPRFSFEFPVIATPWYDFIWWVLRQMSPTEKNYEQPWKRKNTQKYVKPPLTIHHTTQTKLIINIPKGCQLTHNNLTKGAHTPTKIT